MRNPLVLFGGTPAIPEPIKASNNIGDEEADAVWTCVKNGPLSGYLGGSDKSGPYVASLEALWETKFNVKHAIACNSATSGLLAACVACNIRRDDHVITTPYTMSATAAAPAFLGANLEFYDIDPDFYGLMGPWPDAGQKAVITTNLFGHPSELHKMRQACDKRGIFLIEDNAQAILAKEHGNYAGTIGHLGVFSLNVHKAIQCGEGGVVTTNSDVLAEAVRGFINHSELSGKSSNRGVGLNLRLTEYAAAIAIEQLRKADDIIEGCVNQARYLTRMASQFDWIVPPKVRDGCTHSYYCWTMQLNKLGISRELFVKAMNKEGMPLKSGYVTPLYHLPAFVHSTHISPTVEHVEDHLILFENAMHNMTYEQADQFGEALKKVENDILLLREA